MATSEHNLQQALQQLRTQYIAAYPDRIDELRRSWRQLEQQFNQNTLSQLHRQAHSLKGSGSTYGFSQVSDLAGQLEDKLSGLISQCNVIREQDRPEINRLLDQLETLQINDASGKTSLPDKKPLTERSDSSNNLNVLIKTPDTEQSQELHQQLRHFGFYPQISDITSELTADVNQYHPGIIIINTTLDKDRDGIAAVYHLREQIQDAMPTVIFLSEQDDIQTRIRCTKSGGVDFFSWPFNIADIIDTLDARCFKATEEPYRVLIVEDTESLAQFYQVTLESSGMLTRISTNPLEVMEQITDFSPELILMDMYMPECTGMELAAVIRQHKQYVSIPIVYLSAETDIDKQLEAMRHGGDAFLTKPIQPDHLIAEVETRAIRYRQLRSFMVRDSLTGLYNHTRTKELLNQDLYRAKRSNCGLVFAMIDIDKFKNINDSYGHPVGDRVIKSLARLLKQRLRKSDNIGRYGGEEFAIILYDTDIDNATLIIDTIRQSFSEIRQVAQNGEFTTSFSCGLAAFPDYQHAAELNDAADRAMYAAKQAGRNRVMVAQPEPPDSVD